MLGKTHRIGKSIIEVAKVFGTEEACHDYLEAARWPDGVRCPQCGSTKISKYTLKGETYISKQKGKTKGKEVKSPDRFMYQCMEQTCKFQFTTTVGTLFNDTHLPLNKWFMGIAIMCNAKKGASAKQIERDLDVSYKTAWYLNHRIRKAMEELGSANLFTGTVEADETYIGGKFDKRRNRQRWDKPAVFGMIERETGKVHVKHIPAANRWNISGQIDARVAPEAKMMTDESKLYANLTKKGFKHEIVIHSNKEWIRGDCHTQGIDGFWSLLKRGIIGSFHQVSIKHLDRYISEFQFRFNGREDQELFAAVILNLVIRPALRYKALTGDPKPVAASDSLPSDDEIF
jgi:transposase-like protein